MGNSNKRNKHESIVNNSHGKLVTRLDWTLSCHHRSKSFTVLNIRVRQIYQVVVVVTKRGYLYEKVTRRLTFQDGID